MAADASAASAAAASRLEASPGSNAKFKVAFCQTCSHTEKATSLEEARVAVRAAAAQGADLVLLGEMFSCPYATKYFREYGEVLPAPGGEVPEASLTVKCLKELARECKVWLVGGTLPELEEDRVYNTCLVLDPEGNIVARHRKVHLFDIDVPATESRPAIRFKESDVLSPGEEFTLVDMPWCRVGIGICYDVRFPEYALGLQKRGAKFLIYPSAFNTTTGPAHWSILAHGRAVDTQCFLAMASPARSTKPEDYQAWGHSMLVSPWGETKFHTEEAAGVWVVDVDPSEADRVRAQVPTTQQKRSRLYSPYAAKGE